MQRDRFLTGILAGIGVLVLLALILFFIRDRNVDYVDESTPAGVVQNYILALQRRDYERAYSYLGTAENKPTFEPFLERFATWGDEEVARTTVEIGETFDLSEDSATVQIEIIRGGGGIFEGTYRQSDSFNLRRENGAWKIISAPYPYWESYWYNSPPVK